MRRFAAVFAKKRDKADTQPAPATTTPSAPQHPPLSLVASIKRKTRRTEHHDTLSAGVSSIISSTPSTPQLSTGSAPTPPSSVSSSESATGSPQTPDEERPRHTTSIKRQWRGLLNLQSNTSPSSPPEPVPNRPEWDVHIPEWNDRTTPILDSPPSKIRVKTKDLDSGHNSSAKLTNPHSPKTNLGTPAQPSSSPRDPVSAQQNLAILINNSLVPRSYSSPFYPRHDKPCFPRSCNAPCDLQPSDSLHIFMHRKHLLRRLKSPRETWTQEDQLSISPFGSRATPMAVAPAGPEYNDVAPYQIGHVSLYSTGLQRWIARPCFEDRYDAFSLVGDDVVRQRISGPSLAVAALEVSETLEAMAFSDSFQAELSISTPQLISQSSNCLGTASSSSLSQTRGALHPIVPSPLRNEHSLSGAPSTILSNPARTPLDSSAAKRGVRFAEDDKEDVIPLGYVLRMKQRREAKAKFLQQERGKRELLERTQVEQQRRQQEQLKELQRQEFERKEMAEERKRMDEERRQKQYAEEVTAARLRRETQRAGGVPSLIKANNTSSIPSPAPSSASISSLWESERSRPRDSRRSAYESRREASEPAISALLIPHPASLYDSSPGSSQRSSMVDNLPVTPASIRGMSLGHSRPTSIYSSHTQSSSEDVRHRASKRNSFASVTARADYTAAFPLWAGSNPNVLTPMHPVPQYMIEMPLLPPTAPFMLHQYPRQSSPGRSSSGSSRSQMHTRSTTERTQQSYLSPPQRPEFQSSSSSISSSHRHHGPHTTHKRQYSGELRRSSVADHGQGYLQSKSQPSTISRGRSTMPTQLQMPSPWTALPSQTGRMPNAMPTHGIVKGTATNNSRRG